MSYIKKTLLSDEKLLYLTYKHWIIFVFPACLSIVGFALSTQKEILALLGFLVLFISLYYWITALMSYMTSEYGITNKRVLVKLGFVQRQTWETLLSKIATVEVKQSILGRLLGYGTIIVQNTGGGKDRFAVIAEPLLFRQYVQEQAERMQVNMPTTTQSPQPTTETQPSSDKSDSPDIKPRERL